MAKYAEVECYEEHGTRTEQVTKDGPLNAQVVLRTPWAKRFDLMLELMSPQAYPWPDVPQTWTPIWPVAITQCVPDETKYTTDADQQNITYIDALVTVQYNYIDVALTGVDPENPDEQTLVNETLQPYAEFLKVPRNDLAWGRLLPDDKIETTALREDESPGKLYRGFKLVRQYFNIVSVSNTALTLPGTCNRDSYTSHILGWVFPPETLMFEPPTMQRTITTAGTKGWNVTVKFDYKPQGWNTYWRAATNNWERMYRKNPDTGLWVEYYGYPLADYRNWLY